MQKSRQNQEQIKLLKQALSAKLSKNEYIRIQAVLLRKKGYSHQEILEIIGKSHDALKEWVTNFNQKGLAGLKDQPITKPEISSSPRNRKNRLRP